MKIRIFIILSAVVFTSACAQQKEEAAVVRHVAADEFKAVIENGEGQLIDIRTPREYQMGHIPGASTIDFYSSSYSSELAKLDKSKPIYIYCRSGSRTSKSVALLKSLGFTEIVNLKHGLIDWQRSGFGLN